MNAIGQPFREDETNACLTRTRSRIRHDLLPKLAAEYNPAVSRALVRLGAISASLAHAIDRDASGRRSQLDHLGHATIVLCSSIPFLQSSPRFLVTEVLRVLWRRAGWPEASMSARRWRRLASLIRLKEIKPVVIGARVRRLERWLIPGALTVAQARGARAFHTFARGNSTQHSRPYRSPVGRIAALMHGRLAGVKPSRTRWSISTRWPGRSLSARRCLAIDSIRSGWVARACRWRTFFEAGGSRRRGGLARRWSVINAELSGWQVTGSPNESRRQVERSAGEAPTGVLAARRGKGRDGLRGTQAMCDDSDHCIQMYSIQVVFSEKFHEK